MKTSLTEITEDKAKAILDMLARRAGCKCVVLKEYSDDLCMIGIQGKGHIRRPYNLMINNRFVILRKVPDIFRTTLSNMLKDAALNESSVIHVNVRLSPSGMITSDDIIILKAGTTLEELLVQLDLEV